MTAGKGRQPAQNGIDTASLLASIVESSDDAIIGKNLDGIIVSWNRGAEALYGYSRKEAIGKSIAILVPPDNAGVLSKILDVIRRGERLEHVETVQVRKDGRRIDVSVTVAPIKDAQGRIVGASSISRDITGRKQAEEERARLVNYIRLLLDSTDEGIYGIDLDAKCTLINRSGAEMVGYKPEEMLGKNLHLLIHYRHPDGSPYPVDECPIVRAIRVGRGVRIDTDVFWRRDGTSFPVEYSSYPIVEDGVVKGAVVAFIDISERKRMEDALRRARDELEMRVLERTGELAKTNDQLRSEIAERKRVEETLRESETRFRKVFEEGPLGMALVGPDNRFIRANPMLCRMLGYTEEELTARSFVDVTYPEDVKLSLRMAKQLFRGKVPSVQFEKRWVRKTGEVIWINLTASAVRDADGRPLYNLAMYQDVTDRKRAEEEREQLLRQLQNTNQQLVVSTAKIQDQAETVRWRARELETILQSIADGVFLVRRDGTIAEVNSAGLRLIGLRDKAEATLPLSHYAISLNLRFPDGRPMSEEDTAVEHALLGETVAAYEEIAQNPQTHRDMYLLLSAAPVRDEQGNIVGAVVVVSDITEMRVLDKLKDEFISVAAHELKTPVAIMKGYAQALQRTAEELSEPRRKMLDAIDRGANRINNIVQDLLDISRIHLGEMEMMIEEKVDLTGLVEEVVNRAALTAAKHHIQVVKAEPVVVRGDRERLELVLTNLIDNAVRYSPQGGNIDVAVTVRGTEAIVSVTDQGVGIPKDKQKHIFERFYRAHTGTPYDYGGMGVGLFISREVILRHGGRMWFESEEGKGSTFYFSLPLQGEMMTSPDRY